MILKFINLQKIIDRFFDDGWVAVRLPDNL